MLEIGGGWGSFALHAASRHGCRVTFATISREQAALMRRRVQEAGLEGRVEVVLRDYRDLSGSYDRVVSIEMIEAVGWQYLDAFFRAASERLAPGGAMLLQAITIQDQAFEAHKRQVDFIKRHVFPGSCIPSVTALCRAATRSSDLRLFHLEDIGPHYAPTLRHWRERLLARREDARALGKSERLLRMFEFSAVLFRGDNRHVAQKTHAVRQHTDADRFNAIIIANQKFHRGCIFRSLLKILPAIRKYVCKRQSNINSFAHGIVRT